MAAEETFVIIGAGQAGGRAVEAMRKAGFAGRIILIGDEPHPPYERPPLSKAVLVGAKPSSSTLLLPENFYSDNRIELLTKTRVTAIDAPAHTATLADGSRLSYTKLLLATGGRVRTLPFAPIGRPGVFYLRTIDDSLSLAEALKTAKRLAVIGGGFLGLEVAASARKLGLDVAVLELKPHLLDRAMAPGIARHVEALHRRNGVALHLGVQVADVQGDGKIDAVVLSDGTRIPADIVLVSIGLVPNVELAQAAGAAIDNGIVVDAFGRTSIDDTYAAGDVASHLNPVLGRRLRLESWQNAQNQAIATAKSMCGCGQPYAEVPWFWSDQFDVNIQMVGAPLRTDAIVTRGDPAGGRFMAFNLMDGCVVGATAFNLGGEIRFARKIIESGAAVEAAVLTDATRKLKDISAALAG